MKYSIKSFHPFKWLTTPPLSKTQILCYDINECIKTIDDKLFDIELSRIKLEHERDGYCAQLEFIEEGEVIFRKIEDYIDKSHIHAVNSGKN